ncbi:MAG TPA: hypothetical protein VJ044_00985 [Candidatus Hodarchaeales archaeon]|nr:hypothetical protein [Candidatus Hodarchaeales archaeon]
MIPISRSIRPDEIRALDVKFDLPSGATISNIAKTLYVTTDNAKTDVASTKIAGTGIAGDYARIVFQALAIGVFYHLKVEAELSTAQTLIERWIIQCAKEQIKGEVLPESGRRSYWIDFSHKLPAGVNIDTSITTFTAYDESDAAQTDISASLIAGYASSGQVLQVDCENGTKDKDYVINMLAGSLADSITNMTYKVGLTFIVPCREY